MPAPSADLIAALHLLEQKAGRAHESGKIVTDAHFPHMTQARWDAHFAHDIVLVMELMADVTQLIAEYRSTTVIP